MSALQRIFRKYVQKDISPAEQEMVDAWYDSFEHAAGTKLPLQQEQDIRNSLWTKLSSQLQLPHTVRPVSEDPSPRRIFGYGMAAAVAGIIITIGSLLFYYKNKTAAAREFADIRTGNSERKRIQLPDGSIIKLDPGSSIRFDKAFDGPTREIFMSDGEAWYDIAQNNDRPFIIHTGRLNVRVLGTSFNIRAIHNIQEQTVLVKQGKVQVLQKDNTLGILTAGRQLIYDTVDGHYRICDHKEQAAEQLEEGWLVLDNVSFPVLRTLLDERYNINIVDPLNKLSGAFFTASFRPNASPDDIMQIICSIHNVKFDRKGRQVFIK